MYTTAPALIKSKLDFPYFSRGTIVQGRKILRFLGEGGMSHVYLVGTAQSNKVEVLKVAKFFPSLGLPILHEADAIRACGSHPGLPTLHHAWAERGRAYFVMDFIPGRNLHTVLRYRRQPSPPKMVRKILSNILTILRHLHTRNPPVYHMDVKSGNFIIGRRSQLCLIDFGISQSEGLTRWEPLKGRIVGSLSFMPPERIRGDEELSPQTDIYAAAIIGHMLLTGTFMHRSITTISFPGDFVVPRLAEYGATAELARAVNRATSFQARDRFQSVDEFLQAIV